jgi:type II secretory ATPase GspE/PulE/Tfp pilus assembly ATPase PilB-like protein
MEKINYILSKLPTSAGIKLEKNLQFFHSTGCAKCNNLGYKGRIGIYEVMEVDDDIQKLIMKEAPMSDFKQTAIKQGMLTMAQDGLLKALAGVTDVEEVFRVAGE